MTFVKLMKLIFDVKDVCIYDFTALMPDIRLVYRKGIFLCSNHLSRLTDSKMHRHLLKPSVFPLQQLNPTHFNKLNVSQGTTFSFVDMIMAALNTMRRSFGRAQQKW
jgi:hypothetical protein